MSASLESPTQLVDGSPVNANSINVLLGVRDRNIQRILNQVNALGDGTRVSLLDQPLAPGCSRLTPVYYSPDTGLWTPASYGTTGNPLPLDPTAVVYGVVNAIYGSNGDIVFAGTVEASPAELAAVTSGSTGNGIYFLSTVPGKVSQNFPSLPIPVFMPGPGETVIVNPFVSPGQRNPSFLRFNLVAEPAGVHSSPGAGTHVITSPNTSLPGWLPATSGNFPVGTVIPAGALFGYNLAQDSAVAAVWPPYPVSSAWLEYDLGAGGVGAGSGFVLMDKYGIWWMTNCSGQVPWPKTIVTNGLTRTVFPVPTGCPAASPVRATLWMCKPPAGSLPGVTSLTATSGLSVTTAGGGAASTGPLVVTTVPSGTVDRTGVALRSIQSDGFRSGPVVEAIQVIGATVVGSGTPVHVNPLDLASPLAQTGTVTITIPPPGGFVIQPSKVWLNGAGEVNPAAGTPYIQLKQSQVSAYVMRFDVPTGLVGTITATLRLSLFGPTAGAVPTLSISSVRAPRTLGTSAAIGSPVSGPASPAGSWTGPNNVLFLTTGTISVAAGDCLFVTITRNGPDGYGADVGVISHDIALTIS